MKKGNLKGRNKKMRLIDLYSRIIESQKTTSISIDIGNLCFRFWENGNLYWIGNYKNGKEHGEWKYFYENGNLELIENWKNGKLLYEIGE